MTKHPDHICRFNDEPQSCDCYDTGYMDGYNARTQEVAKLALEMVPPYASGRMGSGYNQARKDLIKSLSQKVKDDSK